MSGSDPTHLPIPSMPSPCRLELVGPPERMRVVVNGVELPVVTLSDFRPPHTPKQNLFSIDDPRARFVVYGQPQPGYITLTLMVGTVERRDGADQVEPEQIAFHRAGLDL